MSHPPAFAALVVALALAACGGGGEGAPKSNPVAENCGFAGSPGNDIGVGKYCTKASDCPPVQSGTSLQCSTVLVDPTFPLLCSRLCDLQAADPGCGTGAVCKHLIELGLDLTVCVSLSCQPLFSEPLQ
jgi:hypothetical protein